jgi:hypothetical protein
MSGSGHSSLLPRARPDTPRACVRTVLIVVFDGVQSLDVTGTLQAIAAERHPALHDGQRYGASEGVAGGRKWAPWHLSFRHPVGAEVRARRCRNRNRRSRRYIPPAEATLVNLIYSLISAVAPSAGQKHSTQ